MKSELFFPPNCILLSGGVTDTPSPKQGLPPGQGRQKEPRVALGRGNSKKKNPENASGMCPHLWLFPFQPRPRGPRHFPEDVPWKEEEDWRWARHDCPPGPPWDDREGFQGLENGFEECWYLVRSAGLGVVAAAPRGAHCPGDKDSVWGTLCSPKFLNSRSLQDPPPDPWPEYPEEEQPPPWPPAGPPRWVPCPGGLWGDNEGHQDWHKLSLPGLALHRGRSQPNPGCAPAGIPVLSRDKARPGAIALPGDAAPAGATTTPGS